MIKVLQERTLQNAYEKANAMLLLSNEVNEPQFKNLLDLSANSARTVESQNRSGVNALCGHYHHLYGTPQELQAVLDEYINFYNSQRPHRKLNMKTPNQYESAFYSGCL